MKSFDRYSSENPGYRLFRDQIGRDRRAYMDWIASIKANRFVTLCFNRMHSPEQAEPVLEEWFRRLHHKLYRRPPELSGSKYLEMHGTVEFDAAGPIHYHIAVRVPPEYLERFDVMAERVWKWVNRGGRFHVRPAEDTPEDIEEYTSYMTKYSTYREWWRPVARPVTVH